MRDRLPGPYHRALLARFATFEGGELHKAVLYLVRGYHFNYEMAFPGLNAPPLVWQYTRELGLPGRVPLLFDSRTTSDIYSRGVCRRPATGRVFRRKARIFLRAASGSLDRPPGCLPPSHHCLRHEAASALRRCPQNCWQCSRPDDVQGGLAVVAGGVCTGSRRGAQKTRF